MRLPAQMPAAAERFTLRVPPQPYFRFDRNDYSLDSRLAGGSRSAAAQRAICAISLDTGELVGEDRAGSTGPAQPPTREGSPKIAALLEAAEEDLLAFYRFPAQHWSKLRSTNPLERLNKEIGRRSDVVGIFPNDASAIRLVGAMLTEQNDESLGPPALPLRGKGERR